MKLIPAITNQELADLRAKGICPSDEAIAWLIELGKQVERPAGHADYAMAGVPLCCGNLTLWPCTIASGAWFDEVACRLFRTELMRLLCLGYAMVHARDPDVDWERLTHYRDVRRTINRWMLHARCTIQELRDCVNRLIPQLEAPHPVRARRDARPEPEANILAELVAATGLPRSYWQHETGSFAAECLYAVARQSLAANGQAFDRDKFADVLYQQANAAFMKAADAIRRAHPHGQ